MKKVTVTDKSKLSVGLDKIQQFDRLKIMPPNTYAGIDETIKELQAKKEFFLKKREEEMNQTVSKEEGQEENKETLKEERKENKVS